jgi:hypothetical protein
MVNRPSMQGHRASHQPDMSTEAKKSWNRARKTSIGPEGAQLRPGVGHLSECAQGAEVFWFRIVLKARPPRL